MDTQPQMFKVEIITRPENYEVLKKELTSIGMILCQENGQIELRFCFKSKRAVACSPHKSFKDYVP